MPVTKRPRTWKYTWVQFQAEPGLYDRIRAAAEARGQTIQTWLHGHVTAALQKAEKV